MRVLVVHGDNLLRAGIHAVLRSAPDIDVVREAATVDEALGDLPATTPDVAVVDLRLPGLDRLLTACRKRAGAQSPAVLVVAASRFDDYLLDPVGAGASGVVQQDSSTEDFIGAVVATAREHPPLGAVAPYRLLPATADPAHRPTRREREVIELAVRGLSNLQIADRLYISLNTVKTHLTHVYTKLGLQDRQELAAFASDTFTRA
ncbi:MAG TPA: response regulator transcription factor [Acidimicrobiales bacterium]|nr:response regulator transcription factor [Acidimicrobiales bacterium]